MRAGMLEAMLTKYWWVNHKKTSREEIEGGYLWSPKRQSSGARSQFYDNMKLAKPGDPVVSYAATKVGAIGVVTDAAIAAPKPAEFGDRGTHWSMDGWLLPVSWARVPRIFRPKDIIEAVAPLLPKGYSPLRETGDGNQGAYLCEISAELFSLVSQEAAILALPTLQSSVTPRSAGNFIVDLENQIEDEIAMIDDLSATQRHQQVLARRGQGDFRRNVSLLEHACRCTGVAKPGLLIASHIKPWRACETAKERLDGNNGLFLSPSADYLFDRGFISFRHSGELLISQHVSADDLARMGIPNQNVSAFRPAQEVYLTYHRDNIFLG